MVKEGTNGKKNWKRRSELWLNWSIHMRDKAKSKMYSKD